MKPDYNASDAEYPATPTEATVYGDRYQVATADNAEAALNAICDGLVVRLHGVNMGALVSVALRDGVDIQCVEVEVWTVPAHREDITRKLETFVGVRERPYHPALAQQLAEMRRLVEIPDAR